VLFRSWIGREDTATEVLSQSLAQQFNAVFDCHDSCEDGSEAPLMIHFCLAQHPVPTAKLGEDGHPERGDFLPPVPLPRRMWAGGALTFLDSIRIGESVTSRSTISDVTLKQGKTGPLCFVTVEQKITCDGRHVLNMRQDIVYRGAVQLTNDRPTAVNVPKQAPEGTHCRRVTPTPPYLFRYSAITMNAHRIHYDVPYARDVEGYPGLIVHGPLQATLLCHYAAEVKGDRPTSFNFRSLSPIFDASDFSINAEPEAATMKLWTAQENGPVAMEARAQW